MTQSTLTGSVGYKKHLFDPKNQKIGRTFKKKKFDDEKYIKEPNNIKIVFFLVVYYYG